jgi:RNA polymerase sigma-54 factor
MKLGLQVKLKQTIAPQLIQSLRMLQMPLLKLEQTLRQELSVNPLLEEVETPLEPEEGENVSSEEEPSNDSQLSEINWDDYLGDDIGYKVKAQKESEEEQFGATPAFEETLYDHLLEQLNLNKLTKEEYEIGEYIIGNIDENGYLSCPLEEIISTLKCDPQTAQRMLSLIQGFDPPGVGAKDLRESLLVQLRGKNLKESLAYRIVDEHLSELDKKTISQLAKSLRTDFEEVQKAMEIIKGLSPKPAAGRFMTGAAAIIPDLIVEKIGEEYVVFHNDKNVPSLRINPTYRELVKKNSKAPPDTKEYVKKKLEQARWLVNALNQRRTTMVKVMEAIVEEQKEFFEGGPSFIKPLIMETIANKVGMNVATVSRVSNDKYVQTPLGMYEIRYFFNSGLQKDNGEELSKRNVKNMLEEFIKKENPQAPLSDQEILRLLKDEGIHIARRTVTKYREELKILPARFRKRVAENEEGL